LFPWTSALSQKNTPPPAQARKPNPPLLLMLGGMLSPSKGRVLLEGQSLYDLSSDARARLRKKHVGFVFQTFNLVPYLTALENVQVPLFLAGADDKMQKQTAMGLLERVGLADR
jgi:putative ABC transport system ATP-binding protein